MIFPTTRFHPKKLILAMSCTALITPFAFAENSNENSSNETTSALPTISVMASRGTAFKDMDISTSVLNHQQIQNAPETTIDQIINKIPGIFVPARPSTQLHPTGQMLNIRGFGTSTNGLTLVLLDGIPINDPYFRTINWAQIPKEQVERIEIIRGGGATSLWGNMAMGGVINIVTKTPENKTEIYTDFGSFNTQNYGISTGYKFNDQFKIGLSYDGSRSDGYQQIPAEYRNPYMSKTSSKTNNVYLSGIYTPNNISEYFLRFQLSQTDEDGLNYSQAQNRWNTYRISFGGQSEIYKNLKLNALAWYQYSEMDTQNVSNSGYTLATPLNGTPFISQIEHANYNTFGTSIFAQSAWKKFSDIKFGVDYREISIRDPLNIYNAKGFQGNITANASQQFTGIFAQTLLQPFAIPLDITLGLRQDFWQANDAKTFGNYAGSAINNPLADQSKSYFNPRIGFKYAFNDQLDIRAASYKNFSAPGLNQMYRSFVGGTGYTIPNTNLQAQTNVGNEIGFDFKHDQFSLSGTYFYNKVKNYIDYATVNSNCSSANNYCQTNVSSAQTIKQYINAGNATMQGFELMSNWQILDHLALNAGYSRTKAELTSSKSSASPAGLQLGQIPLWGLSFGAAWQPIDKLNLNIQFRDFPDYWNNTSHTQLNQGALTADISANYQYTPQLNFYLVAQNIGNKSYYDQGLSYLPNGNINTSGSGTTPAYALPFSLTIGAKYSF